MTSSDPGGLSASACRIVAHNVANLHRGPRRDTGLVSQALLGHEVALLDDAGPEGWLRIQTDDTYRGWIEESFLTGPPRDPLYLVVASPFADMRCYPSSDASLVLRLSQGSRLARAAGSSAGDGWVGVTPPGSTATGYVPADAIRRLPATPPRFGRVAGNAGDAALVRGRGLLGTPYVWGGTSAFGVDCSGLVQICFRAVGIILRRDADQQRDDPRFVPVAFTHLRPGDLLFFGQNARVTHVAIWAGDGAFLHASGGTGVVVTAWGDARYSPTFIDARRLDPARVHDPVSRFEDADR
jgi:hypothetical protein